MEEEETETLHIALVMAGAVSAGAYTGGVIDYLLEVLDAWEEAKADPERKNTVPSHRVQIDVICGASAGGMTSAILASMVGEKHYPMKEGETRNKLYNAWVNFSGEDKSIDSLSEILSTKDIENTGKIKSIFNSDFIDNLAKKIFVKKESKKDAKDQNQNSLPSYFSKDLEFLLTLTNIDGLNYDVSLGEGHSNNKFVITQHKDFIIFRLNDGDSGGRVPLRHFTNQKGVDLLKNAAMATGAFPIGLKYRTFNRDAKYVLDNSFFTYNKDTKQEVKPKVEPDEKGDITSVFVDGGMMNNEPFELARKLLQKDENSLKTSAKTFNKTVLLIDPFPYEGEEKEATQTEDLDLLKMFGKLFSALRNQSLFEKDKLRVADDEDYSAFIIAPSKGEINGSKALACGCLGGFGGFLHHNFRKHDFDLGRKNCQNFLEKYFVVSKDTENVIFKNGYENVKDKDNYLTGEKKDLLPIIPQLSKINNDNKSKSLENPTVKFEDGIKAVEGRKEKKIKERIEKILIGLVLNLTTNSIIAFLLKNKFPRLFCLVFLSIGLISIQGVLIWLFNKPVVIFFIFLFHIIIIFSMSILIIKYWFLDIIYKKIYEKVSQDLKALNELHKSSNKN